MQLLRVVCMSWGFESRPSPSKATSSPLCATNDLHFSAFHWASVVHPEFEPDNAIGALIKVIGYIVMTHVYDSGLLFILYMHGLRQIL